MTAGPNFSVSDDCVVTFSALSLFLESTLEAESASSELLSADSGAAGAWVPVVRPSGSSPSSFGGLFFSELTSACLN